MPQTLITAIAVVLSASLYSVTVQGQPPRQGSNTRPKAVQKRESDQSTDGWWSAQRSIEAAIANLQSYLEQSPNGARAESARLQLQALRNLTASAAKPEWVRLTWRDSSAPVDWRIASVDPQADRTRVQIEIKCSGRSGTECQFYPFDSNPLVLISSTGEYYPMLEVSDPPPGVRVERDLSDKPRWHFQADRILTLSVDFAPLRSGTASGQIQSREKNEAAPAKFSLLRKGK